MASIRCGNCGDTHGSVAEVRACFNFGARPQAVGTPKRVHAAEKRREARELIAKSSVGPMGTVGEGFYKLGTQIFKVQENLHGTRTYAKALVIVEEYDELLGMDVKRGIWDYAPGAIRNLRAEHRLTKEQAAEFGKLYGVCCVCGRRLTNEESIEAGIGPICGGKQGW